LERTKEWSSQKFRLTIKYHFGRYLKPGTKRISWLSKKEFRNLWTTLAKMKRSILITNYQIIIVKVHTVDQAKGFVNTEDEARKMFDKIMSQVKYFKSAKLLFNNQLIEERNGN
jgi:hypothetical protein